MDSFGSGPGFVSQAIENTREAVSRSVEEGMAGQRIIKNSLWCERHIQILRPVTMVEKVLGQISGDEIAEMATRGEDVSKFFTTSSRSFGPCAA